MLIYIWRGYTAALLRLETEKKSVWVGVHRNIYKQFNVQEMYRQFDVH